MLVLVILLTLYGVGIAGFYLLQDYAIFWPQALGKNHVFRFDHPFQEHVIGDRGQISALYFPAPGQRKGVLLYLHGNSRNLQYWGKYAPDFTARGYDVFAIDYSGYGKSTGRPSESRLAVDAQTAYQWLRQHTDTSDIVIYGRSLGTAVATRLAEQLPAKSVILETPFYNIRSVIRDKAPYLWLPFPLRNTFRNDLFVPQIKVPVHIVHGTLDELVDYDNCLKLKPLLKASDSFTTINGGRHRHLNRFDEYQLLLDRVLGAKVVEDESSE